MMAGAAALGLYAGLLSTVGFAADIKRGGTITVARSDEALSLDPFAVSDNGSIYNIAQICEPLILAGASWDRPRTRRCQIVDRDAGRTVVRPEDQGRHPV